MRDVRKAFLFSISPVLSLPWILLDNKRYAKNAIVWISLLLAFLSYFYIPSTTNDKAYYFNLYRDFESLSVKDYFNSFFENFTDALFYILIYISAKIGLGFQLLSAIVTFFTVYLTYKSVVALSGEHIGRKGYYTSVFTLVFLSFALPHLLSGIRFYMASVMVLYSVVLEMRGKRSVSFLFMVIAILSHFGVVIYLLLWLGFSLTTKPKLVKYIFVSSFLFFFVSREFLFEQISQLPILDGLYRTKVNNYIGQDDFIENSLKTGNFNNFIKIFFDYFWYYISIIFVLTSLRNNEKYFLITLLALALNNLFYPVPDVFLRLSLISKILVLVSILKSVRQELTHQILKRVFFLSMFLYFILNAVSIKDNIIQSYLNQEKFFLINALISEPIESEDFIKK